MNVQLRMLTLIGCTILLHASATSQPRQMRPMLPQERAEQLQELLGLTDTQTKNISQILQASRKVIQPALEAEEEMRFSMRSETRKILKEGDQQILAILDSKQKEQFVAMRKQQMPTRGVRPGGINDPQLPEWGKIPKSPFGGGPMNGPMSLEGGSPFREGTLSESQFSPMMSMFASERAGLLQDRLGLTDAQTLKIESMLLTQGKEIRRIRDSMLDSLEILHVKLVKERREINNKIIGLLSDDQREKYNKTWSHPLDLPTVEDRPHFEH